MSAVIAAAGSPAELLLVFGAGLLAGAVNTVVGSGSLITFPTLVALGYAPVTANVSNTIGLTFGAASGVVGYRRELVGQHRRILVLGPASLLGGALGGVLLLTLPSSVFDAVIPFLVLLATVLVVVQPRISRWLSGRSAAPPTHGGKALWLLLFAVGVYGGYFGAAQGVILLALLGVFLAEPMQIQNAVKNVLALIANGVAALLFVFAAHVAWDAAALIALGSIGGGQIGATLGRRLEPRPLRVIVVSVGVAATVKLFVWG